jgi:hypothetical protein
VKPGQTRHLPTPLVSLSGPSGEAGLAMPGAGEPLEILDIDAIPGANPRLRAAVKRLAREKAPQTVSQLVLWHVGSGADWPRLERLSGRWANPGEIALARQFVGQLDASASESESEGAPAEPAALDVDVIALDPGSEALATRLRSTLDGRPMLGLAVRVRKVEPPRGPALACQVWLEGETARASILATAPAGSSWRTVGKFSLSLDDPEGAERPAPEIADALAAGLLDRLVRVQLIPGPRGKGKEAYKVRIENGSPLVLRGLTLAGSADDPDAKPSTLLGIGLPPGKSLTVPVRSEAARRLGLKQGLRVEAADLGGL